MSTPSTDGAVLDKTESDVEIRRPRRWQVIYHNDDVTTFDFVTASLQYIFGKTVEESHSLTKACHEKGKVVVGLYPKTIAQTKTEQVTQAARHAGFPLKVTSEPVDNDN